MLQKDIRRRLLEHSWLDIKKKLSNPSQTLHRFKKQADVTLNDLALLAKKLPDDSLSKMFTQDNMRILLRAILYGNSDNIYFGGPEDRYTQVDYNIRRAQLAALMTRTGINFCIEQYESRIEQNSVLSEPIIDQLKKASRICDEIVTKLYLPQMELRAQKENEIYLFDGAKINDIFQTSMDIIRDENIKNFVNLCRAEFEAAPINKIEEISISIPCADVQDIKFDLVDYFGDHIIGLMSLGIETDGATLYDDKRSPLKDFILRKENNGYFIYEKVRV